MRAELENEAAFSATLRDLDTRSRLRSQQAVQEGAERVAGRARSLVPKRTGELASTIRTEFSKTGSTAYVKAGFGILARAAGSKSQGAGARRKAVERRERLAKAFAKAKNSKSALRALDLGIYSPVVEYGDEKRHKPKRPFMMPALVMERPSIIRAIGDAPVRAGQELGL